MRERATPALKPGLTLLALLVWVGLMAPSSVLAHAQVLSQDPEPGARLLTSPAHVRVVFDEPVTLGPDGLRVLDSDGLIVDVGPETLDRVAVEQPVGDLDDGWYLMTWGIVSEDGHIVRSASVFSVGDVDAATAPDVDDFAASDLITWVLRAIGDLGTIVLGGAVAAWWLLGARRPYVRRLAMVAGVAAFVGTAAWMLQQLIDGGSGWLAAVVAWATVARLVLLGGAGLAARSFPKAAAIMVLGAVATLAIGGHVTGSIVGTASQAAHLFAAIVWIGAAPAVLLTLRDRELDDTAALGVVRRFSRIAAAAIVVVAVAGTALTLVLTETFSGGVTTWLQILAVKVGLVIVALVVGILGRRHLAREPDRSRFRWLFALDAAIVIVVVALSAALTLNPPEAGHEDHSIDVGIPRCSALVGDTSLAVIAEPGQLGVNELLVFGVPEGARGVRLDVAHEFNLDAPLSVELDSGDSGWAGEAVLPFRGTWIMDVTVRVDAFSETRGACTLGISD